MYAFGDQEVIIDATTPVAVWVGRNRNDETVDETVYEIVPSALPAPLAAQAGYVIPPSASWKYNNDGDLQQSVGTWYREMWWTMTKANDYKCVGCSTAYDYWRVYGKMRAATVTRIG